MGPDPMSSDRASAEPDASEISTSEPTIRTRRRPRFWVMLAAAIVLVAVVGTGIAIVVNVFTAKGELEAAVPLAPKLEAAISHSDDALSAKLAEQFRQHTHAAAAAVETPFYAIGEAIPGLGANLTAIKSVSLAADVLANKAVVPASALSIHSVKPAHGKIDLDALAKATPVIHEVAAGVRQAAARMDGVHTAGLLPQVGDAVKKFDSELTTIKSLTDGLDASIDFLPAALGADGPRTYLLVFQNNAELRALGGNPAALLEVSIDDGAFAVVKQASSANFHRLANIPISADVSAVYGDVVGTIIQNTTMVPDFPTVAGYAQSFWQARYDTKLDGVISFDPVALSQLLKATGPVRVTTGDTLDATNAVKLLLSTVYDRYRVPTDQDAFFAKVASSMFNVFSAVVVGKGSFNDVAAQLGNSIADRRLLLWSAHADEEAAIVAGGSAGTLPVDNAKVTTIGAWINDFTYAKMGYYLDAKITAQASCSAQPYSISESLTNSAPVGVGVLPPYVTGAVYLDGTIHNDVVFSGPVGSTLGTVTVGGATVAPTSSGVLNGRPVVRVAVTIAPGTTTTVGATFSAVGGASPKLDVVSTPMVRTTPITLTPCS